MQDQVMLQPSIRKCRWGNGNGLTVTVPVFSAWKCTVMIWEWILKARSKSKYRNRYVPSEGVFVLWKISYVHIVEMPRRFDFEQAWPLSDFSEFGVYQDTDVAEVHPECRKPSKPKMLQNWFFHPNPACEFGKQNFSFTRFHAIKNETSQKQC